MGTAKPKIANLYLEIMRWGTIAILAFAPFYFFFSIWLASRLHHLDFLKIWNEVALLLLAVVTVGFLITHRRFAKDTIKRPFVMAMVAYMLLLILIGVYDLASGRVSDKAVIYGWLIDLRMMGFFLVALLASTIGLKEGSRPLPWRKAVLIPAAIVIIFGFMQATLLPNGFLTHFGYGPTTTLPYETVDNQPNIVRIQSFSQGPNPLGAYLVIIITIVAAELLVKNRRSKRWLLAVLGVIGLFVIYNTYSRSGEVGLILSLLTFLLIREQVYIRRYLKFFIGGLVILAVLLGIALTRHSYLAQNIIFHSSNKSTSAVSSNAQRSSAIKLAASDVIHHPLGGGIGSAGPASRRNTKGPGKIAENYYLQIGQEAGIAGLLLFVAITIMLAYELWLRRYDELSGVLLASLAGLTFVAMVSHAWAADDISYIWWGLAGIALAPGILKPRNKNGQTRLQKT